MFMTADLLSLCAVSLANTPTLDRQIARRKCKDFAIRWNPGIRRRAARVLTSDMTTASSPLTNGGKKMRHALALVTLGLVLTLVPSTSFAEGGAGYGPGLEIHRDEG